MDDLVGQPLEQVEPASASTDVSGENGDSPPAPAASLETLSADKDRLLAEKQELWDRLARKQAELENLRKRVQREKEEILQFAAMETVRSLLPVLDDFERALKDPGEGEGYRRGIELIFKRLNDALSQAGLTAIDTAGKKFDPHLHQAVDSVKDLQREDQAIAEEYQRGYEFKGRLLRPAMVKVAVRD